MPYKEGDIVRCRPRWPNKPAFGIWTRDTVLTTEGRKAKVVTVYSTGRYGVKFDRDEDGTFHDASWSVSEDEIVGLWTEPAPDWVQRVGESEVEWRLRLNRLCKPV